MTRRLEPPIFLDPDPEPNGNLIRTPDGRVFADVKVALPPHQIEEIRQGYRCIWCNEPLPEAWPERCEAMTLPDGRTHCGFRVRERQAEAFARQYGGETRLGSRINYADEMDRLVEIDEYEARTGILLPYKKKFPDGPI